MSSLTCATREEFPLPISSRSSDVRAQVSLLNYCLSASTCSAMETWRGSRDTCYFGTCSRIVSWCSSWSKRRGAVPAAQVVDRQAPAEAARSSRALMRWSSNRVPVCDGYWLCPSEIPSEMIIFYAFTIGGAVLTVACVQGEDKHDKRKDIAAVRSCASPGIRREVFCEGPSAESACSP